MHAQSSGRRHGPVALARFRTARTSAAHSAQGVPVYPELLQAAGYQIGFARKGAEPSDHKYTHRDPFGPRFKTFEEFIAQRKAGAVLFLVRRRRAASPVSFWRRRNRGTGPREGEVARLPARQ